MPSSGFVSDSELDAWINEGVQQLHEKLVEAYGTDYVEKSSNFTCNGSSDITLPSDFFKLHGVDLNYNSGVMTLQPYMTAERNAYRNIAPASYRRVPAYKLSGLTTLRILPAPATGTTGVLWYSPVATVLVNGSDTYECINGWERYIVLYAAIQMLAKEESDTSTLERQMAMLEDKLKSIIENRDSGAPRHAIDTDLIDIDPLWVR